MNFATIDNVKKARGALAENGYLLLDQRYDEKSCNSIIDFIDTYDSEVDTELKYAGSELRIWSAQKKHELLGQFHNECNLFVSCLTQQDAEAFTLLAIRNKPIADQALVPGRWHLDSLRRQLKVFLFLNGSTADSGPLEILAGTHRPGFKYSEFVKGTFGAPWQFVRKKRRGYEQLSEQFIDNVTGTFQSVPMICEPGTILVCDTSAIHRARPCTAGTRYALTSYFR